LNNNPKAGDTTDRDQEMVDRQFREREIAIKEAEQRVREQDFALRREESQRSHWRSPLIVAIFTAALAGFGNAIVTLMNGWQAQTLERARSEATRILEMTKTGDPEKAAENLRFLADSGLIEDPKRLKAIRTFLDKRMKGSGPVLPSQYPIPTPAPRSFESPNR
jgi:hypothetical protein